MEKSLANYRSFVYLAIALVVAMHFLAMTSRESATAIGTPRSGGMAIASKYSPEP